MQLVTLGRLALSGSGFKRQKPLLLLCYLSLSGPHPRRYLAELFWPGASDNLNSLSVALSQIRRSSGVRLESDDQHVWVDLASDANLLLDTVRDGDLDKALKLYEGPFLASLDAEVGEELEEWILSQRERLASELRLLLLRRAEGQAEVGRFDSAARLAERAWQLPGAPALEPEELPRIHGLLVAGESNLAAAVEREAADYGLSLKHDRQLARSRLRRPLIGRDHELGRLRDLQPGEWAWLHGRDGMGKSTLLRALQGTYMPARSGLPYATLEPLLGSPASGDKTGIGDRLRKHPGVWLIDDWERVDDASREVLEMLRGLHMEATVIIAASGPAPFPVELQLPVGPLPKEALETVEQGWERTGGLPPLVSAVLNRQPIGAALESIVSGLDDDATRFLYGIAMLDEADPVLVRRALDLPAQVTGAALEALRGIGLLDHGGQVRAAASLRELMERDPVRHASVALSLARALPPERSFAMWLASRALWEDSDLNLVTHAAELHANALMERGFPLEAAMMLEKAPDSLQVRRLRARALERAGQYRQAIETLGQEDDSPAAAAVRAAALFRLGQADEARAAAQVALSGGLEDRAWGQNTLGLLDFAAGNLEAAAQGFRRTAALWNATGQQIRRADALNNLAVVTSELGEDGLPSFRRAAELAAGNSAVMSRVRLNMARIMERNGDTAEALALLDEAAQLCRTSGDVATAARIFNNIGALKHRNGRPDEAAEAYSEAIALAGTGGEQRLLAVSLANLAELEHDFEAWQEALRLFEEAGFDPVELFDELPAQHPFRVRSGEAP